MANPIFANLIKSDPLMYCELKMHPATAIVKIEAVWSRYYIPERGIPHWLTLAKRQSAFIATMEYLDQAQQLL
jgi:hypothetical protein